MPLARVYFPVVLRTATAYGVMTFAPTLLTRRGQHLVFVRRGLAGYEDAWNVLEPVRFVPLVSDTGVPARSGAQRPAGAQGPA